MHLLLLTSELPPEHSGGIARYAENMARMMALQGHSVTIIVRTDQPDTIAPITEILPSPECNIKTTSPDRRYQIDINIDVRMEYRISKRFYSHPQESMNPSSMYIQSIVFTER